MTKYNVGDKVIHKDYPDIERTIEEIVLRRDEFIIHLSGGTCDYKVSDLAKVGTPEYYFIKTKGVTVDGCSFRF